MIWQKVTLYNDVGYCAGGHHVPYWGTAPSAKTGTSYAFNNVLSSKTNQRQLDLPIDYLDAYLCTYIDLEYGGNPDLHIQPQHIYGWIKNVELIATKNAPEVCRITWDVDHWRTYAWIASFGSGHVIRQPSQQSVNRSWCQGLVQKQVHKSSKSLINTIINNEYDDPSVIKKAWGCVRYIKAGTSTQLKTLIWPINQRIQDPYNQGEGGNYDYGYGPTIEAIYGGFLDEILGINPNDVIGAWVLPCCPIPQAFDYVHYDNDDYQGIPVGDYWIIRGPIPTIYGSAVQLTPAGGMTRPRGFTLEYGDGANFSMPDMVLAQMPAAPTGKSYVENNAKDSIHVTDAYGQIIWSLPANLKIKNTFTIGFNIGTISASCILHFSRNDIPAGQESLSEDMAEGLVQTIPLVGLPVGSNTWQSYNVSGQRDYDIESAKAANNAAYKKGLANTGSQAVEGAIGGALVGGGPAAAAGAAIGAVFNVISSTIGKTIDEELRQKVQDLKDVAVANQAQQMILYGDSYYWAQSGGYRILIMESIDNGEFAADVAENGYHADMAISSWAKTTGPWQIENLDVTGTIPTEARIQLRNMLQAGIYIDTTG